MARLADRVVVASMPVDNITGSSGIRVPEDLTTKARRHERSYEVSADDPPRVQRGPCKVENEPDRYRRRLEVGERLPEMNVAELCDRLHLDDDLPADDEVKPVTTDFSVLVMKHDLVLPRVGNAAKLELDAQRCFVDGLVVARPEHPVNLHGRSKNLAGERFECVFHGGPFRVVVLSWSNPLIPRGSDTGGYSLSG